MVNSNELALSQIFSALSDPTRRAMLLRLRQGPLSVAEMSEPFTVSKSAITKHVKALEAAGLITRTIEGRIHLCALNPKPLAAASQWMQFYERFWSDKFDALEAFLTDEGGAK